MKKIIIYSIALIILFLASSATFAQVTFKMKRPPLNQLRAADLWSATIINTGEPFTAYIYGSMKNNENDEMIATGQTMSFEVKKGTTNFKVSDLPKIPDVSYLSKDPKFKKSFENTGGAPPGDYKICCELRRKDNTVAGEDCFDQKITGGDAPQLISPRDDEELNIGNPVFTWMHTKASGSNQTYTLRIVELKGSQSPDEAIKRNQVFFEKEGISPTLFSYPSSAPKFEAGKKYAWRINIGDFFSDVWTFQRKQEGIRQPNDTSSSLSIELISPNGENQNTDPRPEFKFRVQGNRNVQSYTIKIVKIDIDEEMLDFDSKESFYEAKGIREQNWRYPSSAPFLDTGNVYVWQVKAVGNNDKVLGASPIGSLTLGVQTSCNCYLFGGQSSYTFCVGNQITLSLPTFIVPWSFGCWGGVTTTNWSPSNPNNTIATTPGSNTYTVTYSQQGCSRSFTFTINIIPSVQNPIISQNGTPKTDFCETEDAELSVPGAIGNSNIHWWFYNGPFPAVTPPTTGWTDWGTGNPRNTNTFGCINSTTAKYTRWYKMTIDGSSCPAQPPFPVTIYCLPKAGNITINPNQTEFCVSSSTATISFSLTLLNSVGTVSWNPGGSGGTTVPITAGVGIHTYTATVSNGPCAPPVSTSITVTVFGPVSGDISCDHMVGPHTSEVCPNGDAKLTVTHNLTPSDNPTVQWQYQINCTGAWTNSPVTGTSTGSTINTNEIGDLGPYSPSPVTSLCWRAIITNNTYNGTGPCKTCTTNTAIHPIWTINIIQKPCNPTITLIAGTNPKCELSTDVLGVSFPAGCNAALISTYTYQWQLNGEDINPGGNSNTYNAVKPGNYTLNVYSKGRCDSVLSKVYNLKDCIFDLMIKGPCCSNGITPVSLEAVTSTGGHDFSSCGPGPNGYTYVWKKNGTTIPGSPNGPVITGIVVGTLMPLPVYSVTVTDSKGCPKTVFFKIIVCH